MNVCLWSQPHRQVKKLKRRYSMQKEKAGVTRRQAILHMGGGNCYVLCRKETGVGCLSGLHQKMLKDMQNRYKEESTHVPMSERRLSDETR